MGLRVGVVGGGLAGLATAHHLALARPDVEVLLLDGADRPGGKVAQQQVGGVTVDVGAESIVASSEPARALIATLGLTDHLVHPEPVPARIWSRGALHRIPAGTVMGVPGPEADLDGLLTPAEVQRARTTQTTQAAQAEVLRLADAEDLSVAEAVGASYGPAVVDRLVEPLLGGVYAGRTDRLSLRSTMPALWAATRDGASLPEAVVTLLPPTPAPGARPRQRLMGLRGGLGTLVAALAEDLCDRGVQVQRSTTVRELRRRDAGWRLITGATTDEQAVDVDAVVLATPATPTSRLLAPHAADAAAALAEIPYASMAVITLALPDTADTGHTARTEGTADRGVMAGLGAGSGFLVPAVEGRTIKASTFSASKWAWVAEASDGVVLVRASVGRVDEVAALQRPDEELAATAHREIGQALGARLPQPIGQHVQRWGGGLPQYDIGHHARVERARAGAARLPRLALAGAAYDGVGVAGTLTSALTAATHTLAALPAATTKEHP